MSTSVTVNVFRWSALGVGVFYGFYHQLSISSAKRVAASKREWEHKESLISQAKAEWARQHPQETPKSSAAGSKDPNADLNVVLGISD
ncbi:hypothetical protein P154DRAFT_472971 [Amniculicola lignicola CBS 123094]|uniref:ATP synthase F(0) complex subunit e, mitochondrial n=1 Tax=Amniculicola lignicola CBS 123094 TaxID=1392246 RepID=A0A6A5W5D5_9PLEO|nr:hypothetical protein P154DRAFT_472971 [Amniculicola lignicola CBS 123094]